MLGAFLGHEAPLGEYFRKICLACLMSFEQWHVHNFLEHRNTYFFNLKSTLPAIEQLNKIIAVNYLKSAWIDESFEGSNPSEDLQDTKNITKRGMYSTLGHSKNNLFPFICYVLFSGYPHLSTPLFGQSPEHRLKWHLWHWLFYLKCFIYASLTGSSVLMQLTFSDKVLCCQIIKFLRKDVMMQHDHTSRQLWPHRCFM